MLSAYSSENLQTDASELWKSYSWHLTTFNLGEASLRTLLIGKTLKMKAVKIIKNKKQFF